MSRIAAVARASEGRPFEHAPEKEYADLVRRVSSDDDYLVHRLRQRRAFVEAFPELERWAGLPLVERIGRVRGTGRRRETLVGARSYDARHYLTFLGVTERLAFDWEWLIAVPELQVWKQAAVLGDPVMTGGLARLTSVGEQLGVRAKTAKRALEWAGARVMLHRRQLDLSTITIHDVAGLAAAIKAFGERSDHGLFHGSPQQMRARMQNWGSQVFLLQVLLYHAGHVSELPREPLPAWAPRPQLPPLMAATVARFIEAHRQIDRPRTVDRLAADLRRFTAWLVTQRPGIASLAEVTRQECVDYMVHLDAAQGLRTGRPLSINTKRGLLMAVVALFRDASAWQWDHVPVRPPVRAADLPRAPYAIPRFITEADLVKLMPAIEQLECPMQRAALLVARWSGARRSEIQYLELDCLDAYPDGTARLRLPAGKSFAERMVPLNEQGAEAVRSVQATRREQMDRPIPGMHGERHARRLFVRRGRVASLTYLFDHPLDAVCKVAGILTPEGRRAVSAHRFRHTVGTQLAERGARLHTIMSILGHSSVGMSLVYSQISDKAVLADYQAVLGPSAIVAGPSAAPLRNSELPAADIAWLKQNFFRTELELGHCLRLPAEGPCECDLYLTCAKFVTTPQYAPRLRDRHTRELSLAEEAARSGWLREVERHEATARRIVDLLSELGEPLVVEEGTDER